MHLLERVLFLPGVFGAAVGEVGDVEGRSMLGVGAAKNVDIGIVAEEVGHVTTNIGEVGDGAVVHEGMAAKDERVAVDLGDDAATCGTNVGEETVGLGIGTKALEVEVVDGWRLRLVERRACAGDVFDVVFRCLSIPSDSEPIHVQEAVPHLHERVGRVLELGLLAMRKELWEVMFRALLRDGVGRIEEYVGEQARLHR